REGGDGHEAAVAGAVHREQGRHRELADVELAMERHARVPLRRREGQDGEVETLRPHLAGNERAVDVVVSDGQGERTVHGHRWRRLLSRGWRMTSMWRLMRSPHR